MHYSIIDVLIFGLSIGATMQGASRKGIHFVENLQITVDTGDKRVLDEDEVQPVLDAADEEGLKVLIL